MQAPSGNITLFISPVNRRDESWKLVDRLRRELSERGYQVKVDTGGGGFEGWGILILNSDFWERAEESFELLRRLERSEQENWAYVQLPGGAVPDPRELEDEWKKVQGELGSLQSGASTTVKSAEVSPREQQLLQRLRYLETWMKFLPELEGALARFPLFEVNRSNDLRAVAEGIDGLVRSQATTAEDTSSTDTPEVEQFKNRIRELLADGNVGEALNLLRPYGDEVLLLRAQFGRSEREWNNGLVRPADHARQTARITQSILTLLDRIDELIISEEPQENVDQTSNVEEPVQTTDETADLNSFFARTAEMEEFLRFFSSSSGPIILLHGEAGSGKTAFLTFLRSRSEFGYELTMFRPFVGGELNEEWIDRILEPPKGKECWVFDQFEEVRQLQEDERETFFSLLDEAVKRFPDRRYILSVREDYQAAAGRLLTQSDLSFSTFALKPLTPEATRRFLDLILNFDLFRPIKNDESLLQQVNALFEQERNPGKIYAFFQVLQQQASVKHPRKPRVDNEIVAVAIDQVFGKSSRSTPKPEGSKESPIQGSKDPRIQGPNKPIPQSTNRLTRPRRSDLRLPALLPVVLALNVVLLLIWWALTNWRDNAFDRALLHYNQAYAALQTSDVDLARKEFELAFRFNRSPFWGKEGILEQTEAQLETILARAEIVEDTAQFFLTDETVIVPRITLWYVDDASQTIAETLQLRARKGMLDLIISDLRRTDQLRATRIDYYDPDQEEAARELFDALAEIMKGKGYTLPDIRQRSPSSSDQRISIDVYLNVNEEEPPGPGDPTSSETGTENNVDRPDQSNDPLEQRPPPKEEDTPPIQQQPPTDRGNCRQIVRNDGITNLLFYKPIDLSMGKNPLTKPAFESALRRQAMLAIPLRQEVEIQEATGEFFRVSLDYQGKQLEGFVLRAYDGRTALGPCYRTID